MTVLLSPQFSSDLYFLNRPFSNTGRHGSTMWPIMPFLRQDLILSNPVTIIFNHSSDLLFIVTDPAVQSGNWCITCINVGHSINGRPVFRLLTEY